MGVQDQPALFLSSDLILNVGFGSNFLLKTPTAYKRSQGLIKEKTILGDLTLK